MDLVQTFWEPLLVLASNWKPNPRSIVFRTMAPTPNLIIYQTTISVWSPSSESIEKYVTIHETLHSLLFLLISFFYEISGYLIPSLFFPSLDLNLVLKKFIYFFGFFFYPKFQLLLLFYHGNSYHLHCEHFSAFCAHINFNCRVNWAFKFFNCIPRASNL